MEQRKILTARIRLNVSLSTFANILHSGLDKILNATAQ